MNNDQLKAAIRNAIFNTPDAHLTSRDILIHNIEAALAAAQSTGKDEREAFIEHMHRPDANGWAEWEATNEEQRHFMFKGWQARASLAKEQEQKPVAWSEAVARASDGALYVFKDSCNRTQDAIEYMKQVMLAAAPQAQQEMSRYAQDAARYRKLRDPLNTRCEAWVDSVMLCESKLDAAIDATTKASPAQAQQEAGKDAERREAREAHYWRKYLVYKLGKDGHLSCQHLINFLDTQPSSPPTYNAALQASPAPAQHQHSSLCIGGDKGPCNYGADRTAAVGTEGRDYETRHAIMEAECNAATEEYFKARPQLDFIGNRRIFESGFQRGFERRPAANSAAHQEGAK